MDELKIGINMSEDGVYSVCLLLRHMISQLTTNNYKNTETMETLKECANEKAKLKHSIAKCSYDSNLKDIKIYTDLLEQLKPFDYMYLASLKD